VSQSRAVPALLPFAIDRQTLIESALIALGVAGLVVAWGALVLFGRERRLPRDSPVLGPVPDPEPDDRLEG
jgi:hypothetical protein